MSGRYVRLQRGVVGGFVPPKVTLVVGVFEQDDRAALVRLGSPGDGGDAACAAVLPSPELDGLFAPLGALGIWELPTEQPRGCEDIYGMDTSLWLADGERIWHNGAPGGCVHGTSQVHPDEAQRERFSAAVELVIAFAGERAERDETALRNAARLLLDCESEGARQIAEELRWRVGVEPAEDEVGGGGSLLAEPRAEPGGAPGLRWTLHGHMGSVDACAVSADGALVASEGEDAAVRVWEARTGKLLWTLGELQPPPPAPSAPTSMARDAMARALGAGIDTRAIGFSPDGHFLAHVWSELVTLWNLQSSAAWDPSIREQLACVGWPGPGEGWIQACRANVADERFRVWFALPGDEVAWADFELEDGTLVELGERMPGIVQAAFRPDGGAAIVIAPHADIAVGPVAEEHKVLLAGIIPLTAHDRSRGLDTRGLVLSAGNTHAILGQGGAAYVVSTTEFPPERHTISLDGAIVACSVARDRPIGVTACMGAKAESVWVWDLERREPVRKIAVADVTDCALSADGSVLVTSSGASFVREAGADGVVRVWDLTGGAMGLDTYPSRLREEIVLTPADEAAFAALDLPLCEWAARGTFRGKVYLDVVDRVAGVNLGEEWIPPEEVARMAEAFEACDPETVAQASEGDHYPVSADEVRALRHVLRLCADRGLGLVGSW